MIRLSILLFIVTLLSCKPHTIKTINNENKQVQTQKADTVDTKMKLNKANGEVILLGNNIKLLDEDLKEIKDISYLNEQFVEVIAFSEQYYKANPSDDYCDEFKYVKIKSKELEGYVDGRYVFEIIKHIQNKIVQIENNEVSLLATSNFGRGISDDEGLTGCSVHTPMFFSDKSAQYKGLVKMIKNNLYERDYPYFELKDDDTANDEITSIVKKKDKYVLQIKRTYQEAYGNLVVEIYKDKNGIYVAEITQSKSSYE